VFYLQCGRGRVFGLVSAAIIAGKSATFRLYATDQTAIDIFLRQKLAGIVGSWNRRIECRLPEQSRYQRHYRRPLAPHHRTRSDCVGGCAGRPSGEPVLRQKSKVRTNSRRHHFRGPQRLGSARCDSVATVLPLLQRFTDTTRQWGLVPPLKRPVFF